MRDPDDIDDGLRKFGEFHELEPDEVGEFGHEFAIPRKLWCAGEAVFTAYKSKKWTRRWTNYLHEHDSAGVHVYLNDSDYKHPTRVPAYAWRNVTTLVRLGMCLGISWRPHSNPDEPVELWFDGRGRTGRSIELYCNPAGNTLYVVEGKKWVIAMVWGGGLDVLAQGIVG